MGWVSLFLPHKNAQWNSWASVFEHIWGGSDNFFGEGGVRVKNLGSFEASEPVSFAV